MNNPSGKRFTDTYPPLGMDIGAIEDDLRRHFHLTLGRELTTCGERHLYDAAALTIRDRLVERWRLTRERHAETQPRRVAYLSMEFLMGRALNNAVQNLELETPMKAALNRFGCALEEVIDQERDPGLGNGGLGRLAACFLDSCARLEYPVTGYGIRYDYGIFHQKLVNGFQVEVPDHWLEGGSPWELVNLDETRRVRFGGYTQQYRDDQGRDRVRWLSDADVLAVPHDVPVPGYRNDTVVTLRLWKADSVDEIDLAEFNMGDHEDIFTPQNSAAMISMILYPNDASVNGKVLRLRQQYFLTSASLQDMISQWLEFNADFSHFSEKNCVQLNDTHPAVAVPELMRLLIDDHGLDRENAWEITTRCMAYTNHTLLPEALERWPVDMFRSLLPRLLEIIYDINHHFLEEVKQHWPDDPGKLRDMSVIEEGDDPQIRMAYLAIVGSFSVNGVAALHSKLLQEGLFNNFYQLWPQRFNNKTNGVTPRRWLAFCNPGLAGLISASIGDDWKRDLEKIRALEKEVDNRDFHEQWRQVRQDNKQAMAEFVLDRTGIEFDTGMLFDVQAKRIHEYKRQLLNVLHIIHLYDRIMRGDVAGLIPRAAVIAGKAAPGYHMAKLIIKLVNNVAAVINADPRADALLKVAFLPNYQVTAMEVICPGTDLSEQISTAGKEASGTGNMKFMMNGALTIGTLDGANIEIREAVGDDNFFLFGLTADEVLASRHNYDPDHIIARDEDLSSVMKLLENGHFSADEPGLFQPLVDSIRNPGDPWMTAADFRSYTDMQKQVSLAYQDQDNWTRKSIMNTARSGFFSSDRTIREYAREIWKLEENQ